MYLAFSTVSKAHTIIEQGQPFEADASVGFRDGIAQVYRTLSAARRRQFFTLMALMVIGAVADIGTIGAVLPFLSLLSDPTALERFPVVAQLFAWVVPESSSDRLLAATALFGLGVIVSGAIRFELARQMQRFAFDVNHDIMLRIERHLLFQPYAFHIEQNTSTLIASVEKVELFVFDAMLPLMQAATAAFIAVFILAALISIDPTTAIAAAAAFAAMYVIVSFAVRGRLSANSQAVAHGVDQRLRILNESLGGIRDVIIDGSQSLYLDMFERENLKLNRARADTTIVAAAPRFVVETVGILAIALIAVWESQRQGGFAAALPLLGAIAVGAQRLLPLVQQVYRGWSTAAGYLSTVGRTGALLSLSVDPAASHNAPAPLPLKERIEFRNVSFAYRSRNEPALNDISFDIAAGSTVALVGETGCGKSTLADLLMGLIQPDSGTICVDGAPLDRKNRRRWRRSIAHVPQSIFLADTTIAQNIALSCPDQPLDMKRVADAAEAAELATFIESLPEGFDTLVGERGVRLSGGQRQRLGIARALYKDTPILVLDEATSALDEATEAAVMDRLHALDGRKTLIVISHRASTAQRCDRVVRIHEGRIVDDHPQRAVSRQSERTRRASTRRVRG